MQTDSSLHTESGKLDLDAEAWKNKESTTYTSILDLNGVSDLFSKENTALYEEKQEETQEMEEEIKEHIFSDWMEETQDEEQLVEYLFDTEISVSKVKDYASEDKNTSFFLWGVLVIGVIIFAIILKKYNTKREKRRENFATEIDMENSRTK